MSCHRHIRTGREGASAPFELRMAGRVEAPPGQTWPKGDPVAGPSNDSPRAPATDRERPLIGIMRADTGLSGRITEVYFLAFSLSGPQ